MASLLRPFFARFRVNGYPSEISLVILSDSLSHAYQRLERCLMHVSTSDHMIVECPRYLNTAGISGIDIARLSTLYPNNLQNEGNSI